MTQQNVVRLRYGAPNVWTVGGVTLLPGLNVLTREQYNRVSGHPMFKARSRLGVVEEVTGRPSANLTPADVAELYDVTKLRELAQGSDKKLSNAALKQLDKIDEETKRDGKDK